MRSAQQPVRVSHSLTLVRPYHDRWVAHVRYWLWTGWHIATDLPLLYHMVYFVTSLLGTVHFPYWYALGQWSCSRPFILTEDVCLVLCVC